MGIQRGEMRWISFLRGSLGLLRFCCAGIGILNVKNVERGRSA